MSTCICSSCKNLKSIIDEIDNDITESCEFGFPSESCSECEEAHCELTCDHYIKDCEEEKFNISPCARCGIELKVASSNLEVGEVYCPTCYLNK